VPGFAIFDLFHTLVHGDDDQRDRVVTEMAAAVGVEPSALVTAYNQTWRERLTRWTVEHTVRTLTGRCGGAPTDEQVARAVTLRRALASRVLDAVAPSTSDTLTRLRADGWRLGLISNATAEAAEAWPASRLAGLFDAAVFSCEVGLAKPDPEIYQVAARRLGARSEDCVYVGDGADDELAGAAAAGMAVIRTVEHNDTDPSWRGVTVTSLAELPRLLATWSP
jgi:putative hydrolase of the HAD superfamily